MDENFSSFILKFRTANGDHNYNNSAVHEMVRLNQEDIKGDISRTHGTSEDSMRYSDINEANYKDTTVSRSTGSWTGSKSSVAIIYPCYLCNYETFRSTSLVAHLRQHRQGNLTLETERFQIGKFMCSICDFKTRWLSSLKEHEEKAHFNNNNSNNIANINNHTKGGPYICRKCGYSAEKLDTIGIHMRRHFTSTNVFGNMVRNYPCCLCEFITRQLDELQNHFSIVHCNRQINDKKFTSSSAKTGCINGDLYGNSDEIISHFHKIEDDDKPEYPCDYCTHRSPSIHLWRDHMESHGGVLEISLGSMQN